MNLFGRYKRTKSISKNDLANVLFYVKKKMTYEPDEFKKQAWAEVGIELNKIYLHLGVTTNYHDIK